MKHETDNMDNINIYIFGISEQILQIIKVLKDKI